MKYSLAKQAADKIKAELSPCPKKREDIPDDRLVLYPSHSTRRRDHSIYTHKICSRCKEIKQCDDFTKEVRRHGGWRYSSCCRKCVNTLNKLNGMKKRREAGIKEQCAMSAEQKAKYQRMASRKHYYNHLEQERERTKQWKLNNRDKQRFIEKRRRARKANALGSHTFKEWLQVKEEYGNMCPRCQRFEPEIKLTQDHIIPLSKNGTDFIDNIQPLCFSCNSSKRDKIIDMYETYLFRFRDVV